MAKAVIAAGSNLGDRAEYLRNAGKFLQSISDDPVRKSSVWESEPVGPSKYRFLNAVALIETWKRPGQLLSELQIFEQTQGRSEERQRWGPRTLDLDLIFYNDLVIHSDTLIIPHPEYHNRKFVLLPMEEILPGHTDPVSGTPVTELIRKAPDIDIFKTDFTW
ncbi:MAG: 2-amino-4-hydroxy-6-hydroxymethyldihydropteridine diphosphokinase [Balneolaceae bacterium]